MAGVDAMIARGVADPNRLGIGGWSLRRLHGRVGGDADDAVQGGGLGRAGHRHGERVRHRERLGIRRMVLRHAVREARRLHQELADDLRQTGQDADALLLQGEDDVTDPIGQSQQFYRGLKRYGVESDLVLNPRETRSPRENTSSIV